jgi:hypothetical protein
LTTDGAELENRTASKGAISRNAIPTSCEPEYELQSKIYASTTNSRAESRIPGRLQERMKSQDNSLKGFEVELKSDDTDIRDQSRVFFEKEISPSTGCCQSDLKKRNASSKGSSKPSRSPRRGTKELSALLELHALMSRSGRHSPAAVLAAEAQIRRKGRFRRTSICHRPSKKEFDFQKED